MKTLAIIGGGAAGMFCASLLADKNLSVKIFEESCEPLKKVALTGGGRCNFTNIKIDSSDPRLFYPRGAARLRKAFKRFGAKNAAEYFEHLGVPTKEEDKGRMFPASGDSADIIRALLKAAKNAEFIGNATVECVEKKDDGFQISAKFFGEEKKFFSDFVLICTGGAWNKNLKNSVEKIGHSFLAPVPSLFAMQFADASKPAWQKLSGVSLKDVELSISQKDLEDAKANVLQTSSNADSQTEMQKSAKKKNQDFSARGDFLFTHFGASGPAVLELSSRSARALANCGYKVKIVANFFPNANEETLRTALNVCRSDFAKSKIKNAHPFDFSQNVWESLILLNAKIDAEKTWANFSKADEKNLLNTILKFEFNCVGRAAHKGEFVTCGGVCTDEVDFSTMQSKFAKNLFFAGECLDIDAITGGFNLQAAWTCAKICAETIETEI